MKLIAIIDDDFLIRRSLETLLRAGGYATDSFASAEEFLIDIASCKADALLLDIHLKGKSGLELARHPSVQSLAPPMVFISATLDEGLRREALELSGAPCVRKPFKAAEIFLALMRALRRGSNQKT
jgi:DNA-binding response OmpR family regulator